MYTASQRAYSLYSTINKITEKLTREDLNLHAHLKLLVSEEQPYNYLFASNIHLASLNCFVNSLVVQNYYCFLVILWLDTCNNVADGNVVIFIWPHRGSVVSVSV